jgi:hypothetical protein
MPFRTAISKSAPSDVGSGSFPVGYAPESYPNDHFFPSFIHSPSPDWAHISYQINDKGHQELQNVLNTLNNTYIVLHLRLNLAFRFCLFTQHKDSLSAAMPFV